VTKCEACAFYISQHPISMVIILAKFSFCITEHIIKACLKVQDWGKKLKALFSEKITPKGRPGFFTGGIRFQRFLVPQVSFRTGLTISEHHLMTSLVMALPVI